MYPEKLVLLLTFFVFVMAHFLQSIKASNWKTCYTMGTGSSLDLYFLFTTELFVLLLFEPFIALTCLHLCRCKVGSKINRNKLLLKLLPLKNLISLQIGP